MRKPGFIGILFCLFLSASCGDEAVCVDTVSTCDAWETPDNLVMSGYWSGKYDVGWHHMLGRNQVTMSWNGGGYDMRVERDGVFREAFYRTSSFYGWGELDPVPNEFWASYSSTEDWLFQGAYHKAGGRLIFEGRVFANGDDVGSFRMSRPRKCTTYSQTEINRCVMTYTPDDPYGDDDNDAGDETALAITTATVTPNPVEPLDDINMNAVASREGDDLVWTVMMSPLTDTTVIIGAWEQTGIVFDVNSAAPREPGDYRIRFELTNGEETDSVNRLLTVK